MKLALGEASTGARWTRSPAPSCTNSSMMGSGGWSRSAPAAGAMSVPANAAPHGSSCCATLLACQRSPELAQFAGSYPRDAAPNGKVREIQITAAPARAHAQKGATKRSAAKPAAPKAATAKPATKKKQG